MADTSWRDRLRKASEWLSWIVSQQLRPDGLLPCPWLKKAGYGAVELVDATHLKCVGLHGRTWRIHCMYSLLTMQIRQLVGEPHESGRKPEALRAAGRLDLCA